MKIVELFKMKKPVISFEIFPPKSDVPIESGIDMLTKMAELKPDFISVTYGAGGTSKGRTIEMCENIKNSLKIECMAHFTSVGHSIEEVNAVLKNLKDINIENVLALRGDPPANDPNFDFSKNVFRYGKEVVEHVKKNTDFCIAAAAYPEGHVNSDKIKTDLINLKEKVDQGVDFLVTQLFFDNRVYYAFRDMAVSMGINVPINPGIMAVLKADQIKRITSLCGASIPAKLLILMEKYHDNPDDLAKAGLEYASKQIKDLIDNEVDGVHLLTMNRFKITKEIMENVGLI